MFVPGTYWTVKDTAPLEVHDGYLVKLGSGRFLFDELRSLKYSYFAKELQESLNLFYVAITRAKERLYLYSTVPKNRSWPPSMARL